ncbi:hypothetical protein HAX54_030178 [Datura stramonium]|uniref:Uncharacterized protein n=1 Tax=Datura stramonium TaxID=4076 RepID=A0ABS8SAX2_DATST|nr:hypothetical protein [Datura stramonium]
MHEKQKGWWELPEVATPYDQYWPRNLHHVPRLSRSLHHHLALKQIINGPRAIGGPAMAASSALMSGSSLGVILQKRLRKYVSLAVVELEKDIGEVIPQPHQIKSFLIYD